MESASPGTRHSSFLSGFLAASRSSASVSLACTSQRFSPRPRTVLTLWYEPNMAHLNAMNTSDLLRQTRLYYDAKLAEHGPTARGVDWNTEESQHLRFRELAKVIDDVDASVLDYGCGYGALGAYLRSHGHRGPYTGFDISERMLD